MHRKITVFVSYAHEDDDLRQLLDKHLSVLKRNKFIDVWHDRNISAGRDWKQDIDIHLNDAQIILLLVSADFVASDYCYGIEMERALQKHREGTARVIPVILRPVYWKESPFGQLQALPTDSKPVTKWSGMSGIDDAFLVVAQEIRKALNELLSIQWYQAGDAFCNDKNYKVALDALDQAIQFDSNHAKFYRRKGDSLWGLQRYEEALEAFEQAIQLNGTDSVAYTSKGWTLNDLKRHEEANIACDQAIQFGPSYSLAYHTKGWALSSLNRYEEALAAYEQALLLNPGYAPSYEGKGWQLYLLGRIEEALDAYEHALQLNSDHSEWYDRKAIILRRLKRLEEALVAHEQALERSPNAYHLYVEKGITLRDLKRYLEAMAVFGTAIHLNPDSPHAYNERGMAFRKCREYKNALKDINKAIELDHNYTHAYKEKGIALHDCRRYEEAIAAFDEAIRLDSNYADAYAHKGHSLYCLQHYEEAVTAYQRALQLDLDFPALYNSKGNALYHLQRYGEALIAYEQALHRELIPTDPYYDIVKRLDVLGVIMISPLQHGSTQDGKGQYWHYPEMFVYWNPETGIHGITGPIRDKWKKLDWERGILGYPLTDVEVLPDGVGQHCHFQHGCIYWSPETKAHEVHGLIQDKWASLGWEQSFLGYPIADEKGSPDGVGRISNFQHGSIYWTPQIDAPHTVSGEIREKWASLRWERGLLGYPIMDEEATADGVGRYQHFQGWSIFWSPETGAHEVDGLIRDKWESLHWERGILGYPTADVMGLPDNIGRHCHFQHGCIYWSPETGAHEVHGLIQDKWASLGWEQSFLGYPIADEKGSPDGVGRISNFRHGSIYWTPRIDAPHTVSGEIREKWASLRWERGLLGYPIMDQEPTADGVGCYQHFQRGSIFWSPETGAQEVYGAIWARWKKLGWRRILGYPTTGEMGTADGIGRYSHFQHGSIYYLRDADISAHEVHGLIREKWSSLGWEKSFLGYPVTGQIKAPGGIGHISYFQHGAIYLSDATGPVVLKGLAKSLQERFTNAQEFALAIEQARKPVPTKLSVVIYHIDHGTEKNCGYYRIGRNLDANGVAADGWSKPIPQSLRQKEHQGAAIALMDLDGSGYSDMIIFRIDHYSEGKKNRGFYRVGKNLHVDGTVDGDWCATIQVPDPLGKRNLGAGIASFDLDRSGSPDLLVFYVECSENEKRGFYRIGRDFDSDTLKPNSWGGPLHVPGDFGSEQYCTGIALSDLDGNGRPDLIVFYVERQEGENRGYYRIGKNLDKDGVVTGGWGKPLQVPGSLGRQNHGASIAIADLNRNGRPDLVVIYIEHPEDGGENRGYYRIGRNLDADGCARGDWSEPVLVPGWFGAQNQGAGVAVVAF